MRDCVELEPFSFDGVHSNFQPQHLQRSTFLKKQLSGRSWYPFNNDLLWTMWYVSAANCTNGWWSLRYDKAYLSEMYCVRSKWIMITSYTRLASFPPTVSAMKHYRLDATAKTVRWVFTKGIVRVKLRTNWSPLAQSILSLHYPSRYCLSTHS